jgi:hypothetical protein
MRRVAFIHTEIGDDLIVSFALSTGAGAGSVQSLTLLRTPQYDFFLDETERGVSISDEARQDGESEMLREIRITPNSITLIGSEHQFLLNVEDVDPKELHSARKVLKQMNFDARFQIRE